MIAKLTILADNYTDMPSVRAEHGFSILTETEELNVLFDTGGSQLFYENSRKLNIELFGTDAVVLSHGHYDHSGGIPKIFLEAPNSKFYIHSMAVDKKYSSSRGAPRYIGIPKESLKALKEAGETGRLKAITEEVFELSPRHKLFGTGGRKELPPDWPFTCEKDGEIVPDRFEDELSMLIEGDSASCLIVGCSHCSIIDIFKKACSISSKPVVTVIGGSHLNKAPLKRIREVADYFRNKNVNLMLGHCTGISGFSEIYSLIPDKINPISAGMQFDLTL